MDINYKFIPQGQNYRPDDNKCEVVLDVGGINDGLFFDHHFPGAEEDCAAMLVLKNSARLNELFGEDHVTIVIHRDPDFDCSCAAWLVKNYLANRRLPEGAAWLAEYASFVDAGKLRVKKEYFLAPATAMYAFYEMVKEKLASGEVEPGAEDEWILERAFTLFDWCAAYLTDLAVTDNEPMFIRMSIELLFQAEYKLLKEDRPIYDMELNDGSVCERFEKFKVLHRERNSVEEVKALIYHRPTESALAKYWARNDGYIFTLFPQKCGAQWENAIWKPNGFSGLPNRVIAAVPADTEYTLKPLAMQLERAECELERRILGDAAELKRSRTIVRHGYENELWVTNTDPWYDGSSYSNTIIDAPSSLSFLSTEKIISIALNHTQDDVQNARLNIIYPVSARRGKENGEDVWHDVFHPERDKSGGAANGWKPASAESAADDTGGYLFDYARELLNIGNGKTGGTQWLVNEGEYYFESTAPNQYRITPAEKRSLTRQSYKIVNSRMVCFSTGIGFVILTVDAGCINMSSSLPELLKGIHNQYADDLELLVDKEKVECKEPVCMVFAEYNGSKYASLDIGQDVFAACSFLDETIPHTDGSSERNLMERMLLRVNAGTIMGFSGNCTVLASIAPAKRSGNKSERSMFMKAYEKRLNGQWLYEWLLALHQHFVLVGMKTKIGSPGPAGRAGLPKLRSEFVRFTANACFAQVTSDPTGAELYGRWRQLLTLDGLSEEVSAQIEALDENDRAMFERRFTLISFIFFPLSIIFGILQVFPFIDFTNVGLLGQIIRLLLVIAVSLIVPVIFVLAGRFRKKPRRK